MPRETPRSSAAEPRPGDAGAQIESAGPLVTIGIPAYNRPSSLQRAVRSAQAQRYAPLEILVSDDASPDPAMKDIGRSLADGDPRVRVVRQGHNLGHAGNYQWVLDAARREYFAWLADDDWLDPAYVERCLAVLRADASIRLVCGQARYYRAGRYIGAERRMDLRSARPGLRVMHYYTMVNVNGPLFGVVRRDDLRSIGFPAVAGGDWLLVGALASRGRVRTLTDVHIHRSATGLGADASALAGSFGLRGIRARHHHVFLAGRVWREIASGPPFFPAINPLGRFVVATAAAASIVARFTLTDLARRMLPGKAAMLEARISGWLRRRDHR